MTGLHFVGHHEPSQRLRPPGCFPQVGGRGPQDAIGGAGRIQVYGGEAAVAEPSGGVIDVGGVPLHPPVLFPPVRAAVPVRRGDRGDVGRLLPFGPLLGGQGMGGLGQPVVGAGGHDRAVPPGGRAGDPPGEVVGLAAGVHDHDGVQLRRQGGLEPLGELDDRFVQIAAVGRQQPLLLRHSLHNPWVAVPDHGHVVVAVEVPPVVGVEQPDTLAADQVHRAGVEQRRAGQHPTAALQQTTGGRPSVGQPTAGLAETPRDSVYPHRLDGIEEGAGPRLAARGVRGVVRVEPPPPGGDRDLSGKPGRHQIRQQLGLLVLEWRHRDVAADYRVAGIDGIVTAVEHIGDGDSEIADQRRMGHVPEVHDPADPTVVVEQHVVQAHVAVDHLCAQPGQRRRDPGLEPVQNPFHLSPALAVGDIGEQRAELGQAGDIPQDLVVGRGVEKATQRPPQPGRDLPMGPDRIAGERRVRGHLPGQEREKPSGVGPAVGPRHLDPRFPRRGRQGTHHRQAGIHPLDVAESGGLHRQDWPVIYRIRDLEQEALGAPRIHPEVLVPFAREGLDGRRFDAEAFPQDLPGCLLAEGRRRALQGVRALHHRPEGYLAAHRPAPPGRAAASPRAEGSGIQLY